MHEPTYTRALTRAWTLVWHHRSTWALGLLAVFVGQFGLANFIGYLLDSAFAPEPWWPASWGTITISSLNEFIWFIWLTCIILSGIVFIIVVALCAEGALIATAIHWYKVHTILPLRSAWQRGVEHFWEICGINILEKALLAVLIMITLMTLRTVSLATWGGLLLTISLVAVSLLLALTVTVMAIYALGYVIAERRSIPTAVAQAWQLFDHHFLVSLELSIVLIILNFVIVLALSAGSVIALIPSSLLALTAGFTGQMSFVTVAVVLYFFLLIAVAALV